jgi:hypothetical protein
MIKIYALISTFFGEIIQRIVNNNLRIHSIIIINIINWWLSTLEIIFDSIHLYFWGNKNGWDAITLAGIVRS